MFKHVADIALKTSIDVFHIRKSCRIIEKTFRHLKPQIHPGITTRELERIAVTFIQAQQGNPVLKGYKGFPAGICTSVNAVAAHGVPGGQCLAQGDLITIDITVEQAGWYGDAAWTYLVGQPTSEGLHLLRAAWQASLAGVLAVKAGGRLHDAGHYIQRTARRFGCRVLEDFAGHGIGRNMHEDPIVPHFGRKGTGLRLVPGMVFTIEPMLTPGCAKTEIAADGWSIATTDKQPAAQFEHTLAIFKDRVEILSFSEKIDRKAIDLPPFF